MNNAPSRIPRWVWWAAGLIVALGMAAAVALVTIHWKGADRNIVPQVWIGGLAAIVVLGLYVLRFHGERCGQPPVNVAVLLLTLLSFGFVALYFIRASPFLTLPYDLASWSEPMFIVDVLKWRTGASLYLPPDDSNSNTYTFLAPALTYFLAWVSGKPTSIVFYRIVQQVFLVLAGLLAAGATCQLLRHVAPQRAGRLCRQWFVFFALVSFLLATNQKTNTFNIYLHNDPLAVLTACLAFWLLLKHAVTQNPRWLWIAAAMPAVAFLVKQYLAVWVAVYPLYLWLDGRHPFRRILLFTGASTAILMGTIAGCWAYWGDPFRYWTFEALGSSVVLFSTIASLFAEASWCIGLGLVGLWVLLRQQPTGTLIGIAAGWMVMVAGGIYTAGIAFHPSHLGPATVLGGCFALAALALHWPSGADDPAPAAKQWLRLAFFTSLFVVVSAGLGFLEKGEWRVTADLHRYVVEIEREFEGLPADRVLLDLGDWMYLRENQLMKDRAVILLIHRKPHFGLIERIRRQEYAKLLLHRVEDDNILLYDLGLERGLEKEIRSHYREVRRIPAARGMRTWLYDWMTLSEVIVMEPANAPDEKRLAGGRSEQDRPKK